MKNNHKKCTKCKESKDVSSFGKHENRCRSKCKKCSIYETKEYQKTKSGLITQIYGSQRARSKRDGRVMPTYSKDEFSLWIKNQAKFHILYDEWVDSCYKNGLIPSVDRLCDNKGYSFDNIQLVTWRENKQKGHDDQRSGKLKNGSKPHKAVLQYNMDMKFIAEYVSGREAERQTGVLQSGISQCCLGRYESYKCYIWKFKIDKKG